MTTRLPYLTSFRDGVFDALARKHGVLMFAPESGDDKAKVIGYADGQLAGDAAWFGWMSKAQVLMK
jgi:hypothetical protein